MDSGISFDDLQQFHEPKRHPADTVTDDNQITPSSLLNINIELPDGKRFIADMESLLLTGDSDNPFEIAQQMAELPMWQAYIGSISSELELESALARKEFDEWFAMAYRVCRYRMIEELGQHNPTETAIKNNIIVWCRNKRTWKIEGDTEIELEAYDTVIQRKLQVEHVATRIQHYLRAIQAKIALLPSQLSFAKTIYETTNNIHYPEGENN